MTLNLCYSISYAQTKTDPPHDTVKTRSSVPSSPKQDAEDKIIVTNIGAKDLALQERMANITEEANKLVKIQNWIGGIGLHLVGLTAFFAYKAWETARSTAHNQLRAYIGVDGFAPCFPENSGIKFVKIRMNIKNHGQTPAFVDEINLVLKDVSDAEIGNKIINKVLINPSESLEIDVDPSPSIMLGSDRTEEHTFYVHSKVAFKDVYAKDRWVKCTLKIDNMDFPDGNRDITPLKTIVSESRDLKK